MKMGSSAEFKGGKSPVRFSTGDLTLVVRILAFMGSTDPNATYVLRKLEEKKSSRKLVVMSDHISPIGGSVAMNSKGIIYLTSIVKSAEVKEYQAARIHRAGENRCPKRTSPRPMPLA